MTKFSKIRGGVNNLKNLKNNQNKKISKKSAFSLIELSIVLIIIGLLVAGVTGGASLIENARIRSFINEVRNYESGIYTFRAAKGRYPGDIKNFGTFGEYSNYYLPSSSSTSYARPGYQYLAGDFPSPYDKYVLNSYNAVPIEMYIERVIDFKPSVDAGGAGNDYLYLKSEKEAYMYYIYTGSHENYKGQASETNRFDAGVDTYGISHTMFIRHRYNQEKKGFEPNFIKSIDLKIDDGVHWSGKIRGTCFGSAGWGYNTYENADNNDKKCNGFFYLI